MRAGIRFAHLAALLVALVLFPGYTSPSQEPAQTKSKQQESFPRIRVDVGLLLVEATVEDSRSNTIDTLESKDFVLLEDGVAQSVVHFSRDALPLAVVLLVDVSSSMTHLMGPMREAALSALGRLKPEDRVALFTFSDSAKLRTPLTKDKELLAESIEKFAAEDGTRIHEALHQAAQYLRKEAPQERRVIILVSDDYSYEVEARPAKKLLRELLETNATLYNLKVGPNPARASREVLARNDVVQVPKLAAQTGGVIIQLNKIEGFTMALETLISIVKTRYTLGFYPARASDGKYHKLDLRLQPSFGEKGHDYKVLSRDGYYASSPH
jgi:VWFA-related protein